MFFINIYESGWLCAPSKVGPGMEDPYGVCAEQGRAVHGRSLLRAPSKVGLRMEDPYRVRRADLISRLTSFSMEVYSGRVT